MNGNGLYIVPQVNQREVNQKGKQQTKNRKKQVCIRISELLIRRVWMIVMIFVHALYKHVLCIKSVPHAVNTHVSGENPYLTRLFLGCYIPTLQICIYAF